MKRVAAVALALMTVAGLSVAKEKKSEATAKGEVATVKAQEVKETTAAAKLQKRGAEPGKPFAARMVESWKAAGCSDEEVAKLQELFAQRAEASKAKDQAKVKEINDEINKILTPERRAKMREQRRAAAPMKPAQENESTTAVK